MALNIAPKIAGLSAAPSRGRVYQPPAQPRYGIIDGPWLGRPTPQISTSGFGGRMPQRGRIAPLRGMGNYVPGFGYVGGMAEGEEEDVGFDQYLDALREMLGVGDPRQTTTQRQTDLLSALRGY